MGTQSRQDQQEIEENVMIWSRIIAVAAVAGIAHAQDFTDFDTGECDLNSVSSDDVLDAILDCVEPGNDYEENDLVCHQIFCTEPPSEPEEPFISYDDCDVENLSENDFEALEECVKQENPQECVQDICAPQSESSSEEQVLPSVSESSSSSDDPEPSFEEPSVSESSSEELVIPSVSQSSSSSESSDEPAQVAKPIRPIPNDPFARFWQMPAFQRGRMMRIQRIQRIQQAKRVRRWKANRARMLRAPRPFRPRPNAFRPTYGRPHGRGPVRPFQRGFQRGGPRRGGPRSFGRSRGW